MNRRKVLSMIGLGSLAGLFPSVALGKSQAKSRKEYPLVVCSDGSMIWKKQALSDMYEVIQVKSNGESQFIALLSAKANGGGVCSGLVTEERQLAYFLADDPLCYAVEKNGPVDFEKINKAIVASLEKWNEDALSYMNYMKGYISWGFAVLGGLEREGLSRMEARIAFNFKLCEYDSSNSIWRRRNEQT